jgi:hypothetical protein
MNDVPIASLMRIHHGSAAPEEVAAVTVVVACLAGRGSGHGAHRAPDRAATARPRPGPRGHGCWAGCWSCR